MASKMDFASLLQAKDVVHTYNKTVELANERKLNEDLERIRSQSKPYCPDYSKRRHTAPSFRASRKKEQLTFKPKHPSEAFQEVEELYFSGGGGAGRAYPSAIKTAVEHGLHLKKVKVVCGTSVGCIPALGIALEIEATQLDETLKKMPTHSFQDWSMWHVMKNFRHTWGVCRGEAMPKYFRDFIKQWTGLNDPTFKELYDAGYKKEIRIVTFNITEKKIEVFSYKTKPNVKLSQAAGLACAVPVIFPPMRLVTPDGRTTLHTDGGIIKNYPWGVGSSEHVPHHKRLGFALVNDATESALNSQTDTPIDSFMTYLYHLITGIIFQQAFGLTEEEKRRTVAIRIKHNPMDFTPSPEKQKLLDEAAANAVRKLAMQIVQEHENHKELLQEMASKATLECHHTRLRSFSNKS